MNTSGILRISRCKMVVTRFELDTITSGPKAKSSMAAVLMWSTSSAAKRKSSVILVPSTPAQLLKLLSECHSLKLAIWVAFHIAHHNPHSFASIGLLCASRERPCHRCSTDKTDKLPSPHGPPSGPTTAHYHTAETEGQRCAAQHIWPLNVAKAQTQPRRRAAGAAEVPPIAAAPDAHRPPF